VHLHTHAHTFTHTRSKINQIQVRDTFASMTTRALTRTHTHAYARTVKNTPDPSTRHFCEHEHSCTLRCSAPECLHTCAASQVALQRTATHCRTLQHTTTHCDQLQHTATYCSVPECLHICAVSQMYIVVAVVAVYRSMLPCMCVYHAGLFLQMSHCKYWLICGDDVVLLSVCTRVLPLMDEDLCCHMLQYVAVCCNMLQYAALCRSVLSCTNICCAIICVNIICVAVCCSMQTCNTGRLPKHQRIRGVYVSFCK